MGHYATKKLSGKLFDLINTSSQLGFLHKAIHCLSHSSRAEALSQREGGKKIVLFSVTSIQEVIKAIHEFPVWNHGRFISCCVRTASIM